MSDSQTGKLRAPEMCPSAYTELRRASRKSRPSRNSASASSVPISAEARSGCEGKRCEAPTAAAPGAVEGGGTDAVDGPVEAAPDVSLNASLGASRGDAAGSV